jgi:hypothetical protein
LSTQQAIAKQTRPAFTLTHIQTICYYLMRGSFRGCGGYLSSQYGLNAALDSLANESGLMELFEALAPDRRDVLRGLLKLICDEGFSTRGLVESVRTRFSEISTERFPEPLQ